MRSLIVEDNVINSKYLINLLKPFGETEVAVNGREAVDKVKENLAADKTFDLVCLDVMMPEMDGQETLLEIRKLEEQFGIYGLDGVKVIMTTAMDDSKTILQSFSGGCESFLIKPIDKNRLYEELQKLGLIKAPAAETK